MRHTISVTLIAAAGLVAGCGVETASTAATAAALKQKELEAGRKTMSEAQQKLDQSMQKLQDNAQKTDEAAK